MKRHAAIALIAAALAMTPALAARTYFAVALEDGVQIGELALLQDDSGAIQGGARFRETIGPEPYDGAAAREVALSGTPLGAQVNLILETLDKKPAGICIVMSEARPLVVANETRLTGRCSVAGLAGGKTMPVVVTPIAKP